MPNRTQDVILPSLMPRKRLAWENLSDTELLDVRLCDLGVKLERPYQVFSEEAVAFA